MQLMFEIFELNFIKKYLMIYFITEIFYNMTTIKY